MRMKAETDGQREISSGKHGRAGILIDVILLAIRASEYLKQTKTFAAHERRHLAGRHRARRG